MKKTLYTLCVDNYAPEITELTFPFMKRYAEKIGADFYIITERKNPEMPPVYEKLQIKELAKERGDEWSIFFDADALVHPDLFDFTNHLPKDTVMHNSCDLACNRWTYDKYFLRDGRNIGSCNWFAAASDWCLDLWTPLEIPLEEAIKNIHPIMVETNTIITPEHLIDDYTLSRNIAKYGLKFKRFNDMLKEMGQDGATYFWHEYLLPTDKKVEQLKKVIKAWESDTGQNIDGNISK